MDKITIEVRWKNGNSTKWNCENKNQVYETIKQVKSILETNDEIPHVSHTCCADSKLGVLFLTEICRLLVIKTRDSAKTKIVCLLDSNEVNEIVQLTLEGVEFDILWRYSVMTEIAVDCILEVYKQMKEQIDAHSYDENIEILEYTQRHHPSKDLEFFIKKLKSTRML